MSYKMYGTKNKSLHSMEFTKLSSVRKPLENFEMKYFQIGLRKYVHNQKETHMYIRIRHRIKINYCSTSEK
jgi:hypothetical protein